MSVAQSGDLPDPVIELGSPAWQADSLPAEPPGKPKNTGVRGVYVCVAFVVVESLRRVYLRPHVLPGKA